MFITVVVVVVSDLISISTDKTNQLHEGLKKVKIEENNSHEMLQSQNNILNKQSEGSLVK